ncbi:MAG: glycosyltransferase family 2 protein, partial [Bacteroidales bacterium]|nr:glycosyltransferase family 2 protein [Bacteroidales bacterium]
MCIRDRPYTVLLNSDVAVTSNWLEPLLEYMQQHHHVAACQPKICSYSQKEYFEYAGAAGGYIDKYGYPFCKGRIFNVVEKDIGQYNQHAYIFWASGACLFIRTHVYKDLGGLDELFFAHMEEIDLCWRIWARGYRIAYIPSSQVYHLGGATLNKTNPHKTFLNFRNNWFLLYKNIPQKLVRIFFIRFLLDIVAVLKFLLSFEFSNAMSVCKAHFAFLRTYRKLKPSRKLNLSYTTCFNIPTIYKHCIVYQFFFKKKKYYYQLPNINESL